MNFMKMKFLPVVESGRRDIVKSDVWHKIHGHWKFKDRKKSIARAPGMVLRTVCKVLRQKTPKPYEPAHKGSHALAGFEDKVWNST